uniref:NADH-ubiquinone oxidoreductase chain 2 n=1 Tax=Trichophthalma punctata TaxID=395991 RepID=A1YA94_9MUSC|nr:NADH dehydrogenase subunit 2 [Trichophthalma punctata]ABH03667.1 NADH dehydrogenase subunit 2 [Trichophthalma punctata]
MFKNLSKIVFLSTLMSGTLLTISSNSWMGAWMGLEINLLSFIPLMNDTNNLMSSEASLKYFLIQAIASSILLFAIMILLVKNNKMEMMLKNNYASWVMFSTLLLKSGAAPFHFWFPGVMEGLSWINNFTLMTWQKIAPMMLISYLMLSDLLITSALMSILVGSMGGLNQTSLRKIMAFSSISHLGWMLSAMISSENLWMLYFLMYSFLSMVLVFLFNSFNLFHLNQLFNVFFESKLAKFSLFINLLSMGGLPPFLGFIPKWMVMQSLIMSNHLLTTFLMTNTTLITLYFYIRICYSAFMLNYYENNWSTYYTINLSIMYMLMTWFSLLGFPIISLIFYLL